MLVREVMTAPVVTVPAGSTVREAVRLLYERNITAAPVLDRRGRMTGIVSEMDLLRGEFEPDPRASEGPAASPGSPPPATVEEVMTSDVRTARETDDVLALVDLMIRTRVKSVPVVRDGAPVGIVSRRDLMRMLAHGDERIREDVLTALEAAAPGTATTRVEVHDGVVELYGEDDPPGIADVIARTVPGVVRVVHHR
ncbi:CBS domain-containing protein [Actinomadura sp. DC4]|uniref:CBS domain-containing protein n=1 Tax=Actinomadura sp. DC4 TaxID=3055069 RepID=UPI0025B261EB|nr:CBS domain-containing protein [Actinomadura sp. DC4]MDN3359775.1 CBS domain-containing protein [Actinomadura sp. DC4]